MLRGLVENPSVVAAVAMGVFVGLSLGVVAGIAGGVITLGLAKYASASY